MRLLFPAINGLLAGTFCSALIFVAKVEPTDAPFWILTALYLATVVVSMLAMRQD